MPGLCPLITANHTAYYPLDQGSEAEVLLSQSLPLLPPASLGAESRRCSHSCIIAAWLYAGVSGGMGVLYGVLLPSALGVAGGDSDTASSVDGDPCSSWTDLRVKNMISMSWKLTFLLNR